MSGMPGYDAGTETVNLTTDPVIVKFPKDGDGHDLVVGAGQKVKFTFDYEIPSGGNSIRAYLIADATDTSTTVEGSQNLPATSGTANITCTSTANSTELMLKGQNWVKPNLVLKSIKMEFVQ